MKRLSIQNLSKRIAIGIFMICLLLGAMVPALAAEGGGKGRVLRVAFTEMEGLCEKSKNGTRHGLVVDYLNEIAKYTGWKYEYIDTTAESMLEEFEAGKYDLMGGNYYMPGLEKYYAYPDYNIGYSKSVLLARQNDNRILSYDLRSLNGKTIGVYERAAENIRRLKEFLSMNNLKCDIKTYGYGQLSKEGNLYQYLESGEVDLLLGNNAEQGKSFRVAASYNAQPYYIVTNVGNQEILDGLNMAMEKILDSNPNFAAERYAVNFNRTSSVDIRLTEEELRYIYQKGTVTVVLPNNMHPLSCKNTNDMHDGLTYDILKEVTAFSGLKFSYVYTDSYHEAIQKVQQGKADILGFYLGSEAESIEQEMALTAPFVSVNSIIVRNKAVSYPKAGLVGAVIEGRKLPSSVSADKVRAYRSASEALAAVNRGEVDFVYGVAAHLEREIQRNHYANVIPVTLVNDRSELSFALARPANPMLLTILNKAVNQISAAKKAELLDLNMVSTGTGKLSLTELIYANPVMFIGILTLFLIILVIAVLWINRTRMRAAVIQNSLEKAEAESRAKGEFLSRMSHELRTPMNAVVGLADLTSKTQGVPKPVCDNLMKLRASSHYLLDLINDILDMSQLDSGMIGIASEPFSMEKMLDELQTMLETDAEHRGLTYKVEKEMIHNAVIGDAIRLRQVLTNLVTNAFKFTPEGGIVRLLVTECPCDENMSAYTFRVIDTGIGIAPEDQKRIFDTFEQVGTNYAKSQGTGLGLPISHSIVHLMGGELCVKSEPNQGSEFYFTIQLSLGTSTGSQEQEPTGDSLEGRLLEGTHILLAEDNDLNAEIAIQLLELEGASITRVENGKQAVDTFRQSKPGEYQAVLMDIQMPEMNGLEASRAIRALERQDAATIPIVAMTANAFQKDVDAAMEAGMNGFASKPLDVEYLYRLLHDLIRKETE